MCIEAVEHNPYTLDHVSDHFKTQEMCNEAVRREPWFLDIIPDCFKTQGMCIKAVEVDPWQLHYVLAHLKSQEMHDAAVREDPLSLQYVPDWFVTQSKQIKTWHDYYYYDDDELIEQYEGYQKRKTQKAKIKEGLMPIVWHPSKWQDWCMSEDEKKQTEKFWQLCCF